jgi:FAD:protein FMN transferase
MAFQIEFYAMGTAIQVTLDGQTPSGAEALRQVPLWFEEWEQCFSRFRPTSELSRFNRSAGKLFQFSELFWQVLLLSLKAEKQTNGMVTPAVLNPLLAAGYLTSFQPGSSFQMEGDTLQEIDKPLSDQITLYEDHRAGILSPGISLDFGGFAKGWAAHQAMLQLSSFGPVMVEAGGDISISQPPLDQPGWPISIENPFGVEQDEIQLTIHSGGVATSGKNRRKWKKNGAWMHHLIDPRYGRPSDSDVLTATVIGPDVIQSEMAAKMIFLSGSHDGLNWLENQPGFSAMIYLDNGQTMQSSNFQLSKAGIYAEPSN